MTRQQLIEVYFDWVNNFLTVKKYADHYGLHITEAKCLIELSRNVYNNPHPEA